MQLIDGQPVFSATDLVGYLACEHLTALERAALAGLVERPIREDRELDVIRNARLPARGPISRRAACRRSLGRRGRARRRGRPRRPDPPPGGRHDRRDGVGRRRHLPGDLLRRPLARLCRLPAAGRVAGSAIGLGALPLRGRRHEAGAARQGGRRPPDLLVRRAADADPGRAARADAGRARRKRARDGDPARRRLHGLLPGREAALRGSRARHGRAPAPAAAYPPPDDLPGAGRALRRLPMGGALRQRRRDDDHLSLVAGITARQRKALVARELDTVVRLAAAPIPFDPPLDGTSAAQRRARPRAGPHPGRGPRTAEADPRAAAAQPGEPIEPERGLATLPPSRIRATSSSTSRATRTRSTTASTTSSACMDIDERLHGVLVIRPGRAVRRSRWPARSARSSG